MIRIQKDDFSVSEELALVTKERPTLGGLVIFVGTVRDNTSGVGVTAIELEHYCGMTERQLEAIERDALARFAIEAVHVVHRIGRLSVEENIVLVIAVAAHRAAAFDACRYVIDHLKIRATFWKKEFLSDGGERWVDSCPGCEAAASQWDDLKNLPHLHDSPAHRAADGAQDPSDNSPSSEQKPDHCGHGHDHHEHDRHEHGHGHDHHGHGSGEISWAGLSVGIITLSDSRTLATDKSGDALEALARSWGASEIHRKLLPDERKLLRGQMIDYADHDKLDIILTTGGTGVGPRDITPEATRDICDRELPGLAEQIRLRGLEQVRTALLTRGVVAMRNDTVVVNLPGSTRGAAFSIEVIADLLPHVLKMARGGGH